MPPAHLGRAEHLPEHGMVQVAAAVELESWLWEEEWREGGRARINVVLWARVCVGRSAGGTRTAALSLQMLSHPTQRWHMHGLYHGSVLACRAIILATSHLCCASWYCSSAVLAPVTYACKGEGQQHELEGVRISYTMR